MWIRKIGLGILIGVVLCSVMVNAEERNSRKAEPMTVMERMREIPRKIYGKKKKKCITFAGRCISGILSGTGYFI